MAYYNPTETLTSADIRTVGAANSAFGSDTSLIVARPGKVCCSFPLFWFTVPEGFYALVTRHGAQEDYGSGDDKSCVWPPGLHVGPPWLRVSHLVTKQSMIFNTPVRGCKTKDNVTVQIDIAIILRVMGDVERGEDPQNVYKFVHFVTARGLQQQLNDAQAEAVRALARSVTHTEVFGLRSVSQEELTGVRDSVFVRGDVIPGATVPPGDSGAAAAPGLGVEEWKEEEGDALVDRSERSSTSQQEEKDMLGEHDEFDPVEAGFNTETGASVTDVMRDRLNRQFKQQGVEILDVIIQQITLPDEIQQQMSQKTMVISQNAAQRMQQKYDMLSLSQTEAIKTLKQSQDEEQMELIKDGKYAVLQEQLELSREMAEGEQVLRNVTTQMIIDVDLVNAESNLTVQRIRDQTKLDTERIRETTEAEAAVITVAAEAEVKEQMAEAELKCAQLSAKGDKAIFNAEGISAPKNRTLNDHTTSLKRLEAQASLASNDKLIVTGTSGGDAANRLMLADAALKDSARRRGKVAPDPSERSALLSEIAIASGQAQVRLNVWGEQPHQSPSRTRR